MLERTTLKIRLEPNLTKPTALVGSPGLRSIGKIAIDHLLHTLGAEEICELYSIHFPLIHFTLPSYAADPNLPGEGGTRVEKSIPALPLVRFFQAPERNIVIVDGYHANFSGQYEVATKTLEFLQKLEVSRIIVLAGYGHKGKDVVVASTTVEELEKLRKINLEPGYEGPFYGFSGLVFGLSKTFSIPAISLFARTEPVPEDPEFPDPSAARTLLNKLSEILGFEIDISRLVSA